MTAAPAKKRVLVVGGGPAGCEAAMSAKARGHEVELWEASDRICDKRLQPLLPLLVSALERHGHLALDATVRSRVLAASAATLDRLLRPTRAAVAGQRELRRAVPAVQRNVPVRTFAEWEDTLPGDMEADLVSHGGDSAAGSFVLEVVTFFPR